MKFTMERDYKESRKRAYPDIGEQLDAVHRLAKALIANGTTVPPEVNQWVAKLDSVKQKYPKNNEN
jgi:hypothetical protein